MKNYDEGPKFLIFPAGTKFNIRRITGRTYLATESTERKVRDGEWVSDRGQFCSGGVGVYGGVQRGLYLVALSLSKHLPVSNEGRGTGSQKEQTEQKEGKLAR